MIESSKHCESLKDIINIAENLGLFDMLPAFSPEMYGDFLAEMYRDHFAGQFETLEKSHDAHLREFAAHITKLDDHLDSGSYGRAITKEENGVFIEQTEVMIKRMVGVHMRTHCLPNFFYNHIANLKLTVLKTQCYN